MVYVFFVYYTSLIRKRRPLRPSPQQPYASGPMVVLGGGQFLMSEVSLQRESRFIDLTCSEVSLHLLFFIFYSQA